jgi:HK97 family phage prohead protease
MNLCAIKSVSNDGLVFNGYASVFDYLDSHNEIMIKGAFFKSIQKHNNGSSRIKLLWQHDIHKPIGVINKIAEDDKGLFVDVALNNSVNQGREVAALVKQKAIDSFSVGFNIEKYRINNLGQKEICDADLWEVSVVTFPANQAAKIENIGSNFLSKNSLKKNAHQQSLCQLNSLLLNKSTTIFR